MLTLTPNPKAVPLASSTSSVFRDRPQSFVQHLEELRWRILKSLAWIAAFSIVGWWSSDAVIAAMARITGPLIFLEPTEAFFVKLEIALVVGLFLSVPAVLYHAWRYIGIAFSLSEQRVILGALPFSYLLFAAGSALGWFFIIPTGMRYLVGFATPSMQPALSVDACFNFCAGMTLGMGLLFQLPIMLTLLAYWGIIDAAWLSRYRRHAVIAIFLLAGVLTPGPDVISQLLLALPTYALFELSILLAKTFGREKNL